MIIYDINNFVILNEVKDLIRFFAFAQNDNK